MLLEDGDEGFLPRLEGRNYRWVELAACLALDQLSGFRNRHGLPIWTVRRQRVEDVGNAEDANLQRNRLTAQRVRIARAVPALVVMADPAQTRVQERNIFQHLVADDGVLPHLFRLEVVESAGLAQNVVFDPDLAENRARRRSPG